MRITIETTNEKDNKEKLIFESEHDGGHINYMMLVFYRALIAWGFSESNVREAFRLEEDEDLWDVL